MLIRGFPFSESISFPIMQWSVVAIVNSAEGQETVDLSDIFRYNNLVVLFIRLPCPSQQSILKSKGQRIFLDVWHDCFCSPWYITSWQFNFSCPKNQFGAFWSRVQILCLSSLQILSRFIYKITYVKQPSNFLVIIRKGKYQ